MDAGPSPFECVPLIAGPSPPHRTRSTVTLNAHRHGATTEVVAITNQLRTSKVDNVVRFLFNQLPYQPGDEPPEPEQAGH